jgi:hypothetical protein
VGCLVLAVTLHRHGACCHPSSPWCCSFSGQKTKLIAIKSQLAMALRITHTRKCRVTGVDVENGTFVSFFRVRNTVSDKKFESKIEAEDKTKVEDKVKE